MKMTENQNMRFSVNDRLLAFIENNADSKNVKRCALEIKKQIIGGGTFAETLGKYRNTFGNIYVGLVSAGEDSGELDKTLERMLELLRKQEQDKYLKD